MSVATSRASVTRSAATRHATVTRSAAMPVPLVKKRSSAYKRRKLKRDSSSSDVTVLDETCRRFAGSFSPTNVLEQKERFLKYGLTPEFVFSKGRKAEDVERRMQSNSRHNIHTEYFLQAKAILDKVKDEYVDGMALIEEMYGAKISQEQATEYIQDYLKQHDLTGDLPIYWSPSLTGR